MSKLQTSSGVVHELMVRSPVLMSYWKHSCMELPEESSRVDESDVVMFSSKSRVEAVAAKTEFNSEISTLSHERVGHS
jgi:hypothetical protein